MKRTKFITWKRARALAAVCAIVMLITAMSVSASAEGMENTGKGMPQQRGQMQPSGGMQQRGEMPGGQRMQGNGFRSAFDGEEPPEKPEDGFPPEFDGEEPPEKPEGGFPPESDGEEPPEKPEGDLSSELPEEETQQNRIFGRGRKPSRRMFRSEGSTGSSENS